MDWKAEHRIATTEQWALLIGAALVHTPTRKAMFEWLELRDVPRELRGVVEAMQENKSELANGFRQRHLLNAKSKIVEAVNEKLQATVQQERNKRTARELAAYAMGDPAVFQEQLRKAMQ